MENNNKKSENRAKMMADIIRQQSEIGFRGDNKVRWKLPDADQVLMRGLAYAIGPKAQWLPEYEQVAEWLGDNKGKGLMCIGDCGRGKSVITRDVLPLIMKNYIHVYDPSTGTYFHPVYRYFLAKELKERWNEILQCKIICIDDVGTETMAMVYGERHNYFAELVDICNDRDKLLICSTNLTQEQLFGGTDDDGVNHPQRYDQRIFSRLVGNTRRVYFEGEDLRIGD